MTRTEEWVTTLLLGVTTIIAPLIYLYICKKYLDLD